MDKKKLVKTAPSEDLKGFEEFIEGQPHDTNFLPRGVGGGAKRETNFEHFTFLTNDSTRLLRLRGLLAEKVPFAGKHPQGEKLLASQMRDINFMKKKIFEESEKPNSAYRKSLADLFDGFFGPAKS
jgi:hypothetical protein